MSSSTPALFQPIKVGAIELKHRVVLAPLTRLRAGKKSHVPDVALAKAYYTQRGSRPGTLLLTDASYIAAKAGGRDNVPGIWSQEQIDAWKEITAAVHETQSFIFLQIRGLGRSAIPEVLESEGFPYVAPSPIPLKRQSKILPRELTLSEIQKYIALFAKAAENAIGSGFDGIELHGANGYLIDQFLQDVSNQRNDQYGGSIENRSRFALEVVKAVVNAIGEERVGIRLSPWSIFQDMRMDNPIPQFSHFVSTLKQSHPNFAYIHVIESDTPSPSESIDFLRDIWKPKPFISANGYTRESALRRAEEKGDIIAFGRHFISNPDLVNRLEYDIPLAPYHKETFYVPAEDPNAAVGYIDYPFASVKSREHGNSVVEK